MRVHVIAFLSLVLLGLSSAHPSDVLKMLQGDWISDKEGTIAELKKDPWWTEQKLDAIVGALGKLAVRYSGSTCIAEMDDLKRTYEVKVIQEATNTATLEWEDPELGLQRSTVEVYDDHVWVVPNDSEVFRERFIRYDK
ncbi:MAG: hypothetical protein IAE97_13675 [Chthoniobacterales bacterium]|nr:hypothetical protein [Chthoniobacterales bacterium]